MKKFFRQLAVIFPLLLVYAGMFFYNIDYQINNKLKLLAFVYMVAYVLIRLKWNKNLWWAFLVFVPFFVHAWRISFDSRAALEDGVRYLFPVVVLFYSYAVRKHLDVLVKFWAIFIVLNFFTQLRNYYFWLQGADQWFYYKTVRGVRYYNATMGILRGTGLVTDFDLFGFMNLIGFIVIKNYYKGKWKRAILTMAALGIIMSLSYKIIGAALILLIVDNIKKLHKTLALLLLGLIGFSMAFPRTVNEIKHQLQLRVEDYITRGHSARADSYIVMYRQIKKGNLFGTGIGTFGGPASTKYRSPYYEKFGFNWYGIHYITTTDTYPPHPFVELGLLGALWYFFVITVPLFRRRLPKTVLYIYFVLFVDMLFTFSLNNLAFLLASLIFVYPIIYYHERHFRTY